MIKLPGKMKHKKILLMILVIISLILIIKEGISNRQEGTVNENTQIVSEEESDTIEVEEAEDAVEINAEEEELYTAAYNSFFQGEYEETITKANEILEKYPNSYKAYNIRGIAKAFSVGFNEGMEDVDKALEINADYGYARYNKAFCYELYEEFDNALIWYDKALEIEEYMWSYYGKASIYGRRGDVENTILYLKKAIEVEGCADGEESGIKTEARTEKDFDPVRDSEEFQELIG